MHMHTTPDRHIYASHWQFVRSYRPRRTALGYLAAVVTLAVTALVVWLIVTDPVALLTTVAIVALWLMVMGARR